MNLSTRIKDALCSEKAEYFCSAFLFHSIVLLILALVVGKSFKINHNILMVVTNENEEIFENEVIMPETHIFDEEKTSLTEQVVIDDQQDSSLSVTNLDTPQVSDVQLDPVDYSSEIQASSINETISGLSNNIGSGFSAENNSGGALDRLTREIIFHAEQKPTNVIWLFDASISLTHQRKFISQRFDKILYELGIASTKNKIAHGIYSFGKSLTPITLSLTDNTNILKTSIDSIIIDESGIENTFGAIGQICKKYSKPYHRLLIIVFTDEVGDDSNLLDDLSKFATSKGCVVYAVGSPAPFGKSTTQFKFVDFDPQYDQKEKWVEIQQGPESSHDIILDIKTLPIDDETLDSGFGPFALSKLCLDTGGLFLGVHSSRTQTTTKVHKKDISPLSSYVSRFFDQKVMSQYKPDYRSIIKQNKEYNTDKVKHCLVEASKIPLHISGSQTYRFKAYNEGIFSEQLSMAQRFSAKVEPQINKIYSLLIEGEKHIDTVKENRILASYYLAMGRILATKCRIESYNTILAQAKSGIKKKDPLTNYWILLPSKTFNTENSVLNKAYASSQKYLKLVEEKFPDTPWALIAHEELNTPMGYIWTEHYEEPPKPNNGGGNNNPQDDKAGPKLVPKPQRKIDKI
jgi:hypothetical protein